MAARRTYTPTEKTAALDLYRTDGPTAVEKQLGIPKATVASWARRTRVHTVRNTKTAAATEAASLDAAAARARITSSTISAADKTVDSLLQRLDAEAGLISLKDLATIYGILVDKTAILDRLNARHDDHKDAKSVIGDLMGALAADYERRHP